MLISNEYMNFYNLIANLHNSKQITKASKCVYRAIEKNYFRAYIMWRELISACCEKKFISTVEFKIFILKSISYFIGVINLEQIILMILSIDDEFEELIISHIFINPKCPENLISHLIEILLINKQYENEKEVILLIKKYSRYLNNQLFNTNDIYENIIKIHLNKKGFDSMPLEEQEIIRLILNVFSENKKIIAKLIYSNN